MLDFLTKLFAPSATPVTFRHVQFTHPVQTELFPTQPPRVYMIPAGATVEINQFYDAAPLVVIDPRHLSRIIPIDQAQGLDHGVRVRTPLARTTADSPA